MRHRKVNKKLDRKKAPRVALLKSLATSLILYERIKTTEAKAKTVKPLVEKLITRGKVKSIHNKQQLGRFLLDKKAVQKVLDVLGQRYATRSGGYCRIVKMSPRVGDRAKMALLELVDSPVKAGQTIAARAPKAKKTAAKEAKPEAKTE